MADRGRIDTVHIDTLTLMLPGSFASILASLLLVGAWIQDRKAGALLWWAAASLLHGVGVAAMLAGLSTGATLAIMTGVGLSSAAPALYWGGIRRFNGRSTPLPLILLGLLAWFASRPVAQLLQLDHEMWSALVSFTLWYVYLAAGIWELWKSRGERLSTRWPLIALLAVHALVYGAGTIDLLTGVLVLGAPPELFSWFGAIHFESIAFSMVGSILMILLCRERIERGHIEAAGIDPLTGIANRRSLLEGAERLLRRSQESGAPLSIAMFDLDHFKHVNDAHGHEVGDRVLRGFTQTVRGAVRPTDLFGRYGGEEFLLLMPGVSIEAAFAVADRARFQFAQDYKFIDGRPLAATFSAGVALAASDATVEQVIAAADAAMYVAKNGGRNRVVRAATIPLDPASNVVRLA